MRITKSGVNVRLCKCYQHACRPSPLPRPRLTVAPRQVLGRAMRHLDMPSIGPCATMPHPWPGLLQIRATPPRLNSLSTIYRPSLDPCRTRATSSRPWPGHLLICAAVARPLPSHLHTSPLAGHETHYHGSPSAEPRQDPQHEGCEEEKVGKGRGGE